MPVHPAVGILNGVEQLTTCGALSHFGNVPPHLAGIVGAAGRLQFRHEPCVHLFALGGRNAASITHLKIIRLGAAHMQVRLVMYRTSNQNGGHCLAARSKSEFFEFNAGRIPPNSVSSFESQRFVAAKLYAECRKGRNSALRKWLIIAAALVSE